MDCVGNDPSEQNTIELNELTLEECFKNIIEGSVLELDLNNLNSILKKDLQVNFYILKPKVKSVLSYMLVHFIKSWPGWQKASNYINKQITFESWFAKFKEYLVFKINYLIKNDFEKVSVMLKSNTPIDESVLFKIDNSTQSMPVTEKPQAPYTIEVQGVPKMLNSLVFCEGEKDNIIVKEYRTNPFVEKLTTKQLINWPYIEVEFMSKELQFKRRNMHDYKRYLMFSSEKITFRKADALIEEIEIINEELIRAAYTLNVIKEYCKLYVNVMRKHQKALNIPEDSIAEVITILEDFMLDIVEINMNSIATNTSVLFNIGTCIYARNKSVRTSDQAVCFAESITPRMNLSLIDFTGIKDEKSPTPFELLQEINTSTNISDIRSYMPNIKYNCTFCNKSYNSKLDILEHLKQRHCMEQPVLCFKCKLQLNISHLAKNRWQHQCNISSKGEVESRPR